MNPGERKVPRTTAFAMIGVAVVFDLLNIAFELIPVIGFVLGLIIDLLLTGIFFVWFDHYNVKLFGPKNFKGTMLAMAANAFPLTDLAFPWAIRVSSLAFSERKEIPAEIQINRNSGFRL